MIAGLIAPVLGFGTLLWWAIVARWLHLLFVVPYPVMLLATVGYVVLGFFMLLLFDHWVPGFLNW